MQKIQKCKKFTLEQHKYVTLEKILKCREIYTIEWYGRLPFYLNSNTYINTYACTYMYVYMYSFSFLYIRRKKYMYIHICAYTYICVCIYMYTYVYIF